MPTYEYRCPEGHTFDRFAKMSEAAVELPCPTCGKPAVRQVSGGAGLVFKGSGFYLTDYGKNAHRTGGDSKPAGSGSKHDGGESSGESTSKDPAPAAASDASTPSTASAAKPTESPKSTSDTSTAAKSPSKKTKK